MVASTAIATPCSLHVTVKNVTPVCLHATRRLSSPMIRLRHSYRYFSWGARHKWGGTVQGKHVQEKIKKAMIARAGYRYPYLDRQLFFRRCLPAQGWRSASHWRNSQASWQQRESEVDQDKKSPETQEEDWYSRWEKQKKQQYEEFIKKIEEDPFTALFGRSNRWLGWTSGTASEPSELASAMSGKRNPDARSPNPADKIDSALRGAPAEVDKTTSKPDVVKASSSYTQASKKPPDSEYEIDPITLRKVPRSKREGPISVEKETRSTTESTKIPIKTFKPSPNANDTEPTARTNKGANSTDSTPSAGTKWLIKEGFESEKPLNAPTSKQRASGTSSTGMKTKIESALDRHIQQKKLASRGPQSVSEYDAKENRTEDVDLLRASDIRASAGTRGHKNQITNVEKDARQRELEERFEMRPSQLEERLQQEIAEAQESQASASKTRLNDVDAQYMNKLSDESDLNVNTKPGDQTAMTATPTKLSLYANEKANEIKTKILPLRQQIDFMKAEYDGLRKRWLQETRRTRSKKARDLHEEEIRAQKKAMERMEMQKSERKPQVSTPIPAIEDLHRGEGDVATNVHEFSTRQRWYKRKAPHAQDELDAKVNRLGKERALIREVRDIYEDTYGIINTEHRQPSMVENTASTAESSHSEKHMVLKEEPHASLIDTSTSTPPMISQQDMDARPPQHEPLPSVTGEQLRFLIREIESELESVDKLVKAQIEQTNSDTNTSMIIKSTAYKQNMINILKTTSKLANTTPALRRELMDCVISVAGICWQANIALFSRALAISKSKEPNDTLSTQNDPASGVDGQIPTTPSTYRILAYDSSTQRVTSAKATSPGAFENEHPLKPLEALTLLQNPGKFLPQVMALHNKGYDIVSGASHILVLKKVRNSHPGTSIDESRSDEHYPRSFRPNPIDGTVSSTGNYASPTGFVNHDSILTPEELEKLVSEQQKQEEAQQKQSGETASDSYSAPTSAEPGMKNHPNDRVRREEDVFSGPSRRGWHEGSGGKRFGRNKHRRAAERRRTLRRMILTGTVTAAVCYAVGVAVEILRV